MKKILLITLSIISLTALAQTPDWFNAETRKADYPDTQYIVGYIERPYNAGENTSKAMQVLKDVAKEKIQREFKAQILYPSINRDLIKTIEKMESVSYKTTNDIFNVAKPAIEIGFSQIQVEAWNDTLTSTIAAFAYLPKSAIVKPLEEKVTTDLTNIETILNQIDQMALEGKKSQTLKMLDSIPPLFDKVYEVQKMLAAMDVNASEESLLLQTTRIQQHRFSGIVNELQNSLKIALICYAHTWEGVKNNTLEKEIKGALSEFDCNFVSTHNHPDYIIDIYAKARELQSVNEDGSPIYVFIDARISIVKVATGKRIYENQITAKGGSASNAENAHRKAFQNLSSILAEIIIKQIKE